MKKYRVTRSQMGPDGYNEYKDTNYTENEVLEGICVYKYDSIVEIKELEEDDPVYIAFKQSKDKHIKQAEANKKARLEREKQQQDAYIKAEYEKRFN